MRLRGKRKNFGYFKELHEVGPLKENFAFLDSARAKGEKEKDCGVSNMQPIWNPTPNFLRGEYLVQGGEGGLKGRQKGPEGVLRKKGCDSEISRPDATDFAG